MPNYDLKEVKALDYKRPDIVNGYSDQTLYLNMYGAGWLGQSQQNYPKGRRIHA